MLELDTEHKCNVRVLLCVNLYNLIYILYNEYIRGMYQYHRNIGLILIKIVNKLIYRLQEQILWTIIQTH